jgi:hypothetical protein
VAAAHLSQSTYLARQFGEVATGRTAGTKLPARGRTWVSTTGGGRSWRGYDGDVEERHFLSGFEVAGFFISGGEDVGDQVL